MTSLNWSKSHAPRPLVALRTSHGTQFWLRTYKGIQFILIFHGLLTCKFAYSPKFICNPKSIPWALLQSFMDTCGEAKICHPKHVASWGQRKWHLLSCLSFHTVNKCPFHDLFSAMFFSFLCFFTGDYALWNVPQVECCSAVEGSRAQKAVLCFTEEASVFDKLRSGVRYSAAGLELNVHESTMLSKLGGLKQKHT